MKEDSASWEQFVRGMIERGLRGVRLVVGDRCAGLVSTVRSMLPRAGYQRCMGGCRFVGLLYPCFLIMPRVRARGAGP